MSLEIIIKDVKYGHKKNVEVNRNDTIKKLKEKYRDVGAILIYNRSILDDSKLISDYGIEDYDTIFSIRSMGGGGIRIIIVNLINERKCIIVDENDTIKKAKEKCGEVEAVWKLDDLVLNESKLISDYNIKYNDVIISLTP